MNSIRSALSAIISIEGIPAGKHPMVRRFMRAVFNEQPVSPKSTGTWDPGIILRYYQKLGKNRNLNLSQLTRKLNMLLLILSAQRFQTIHLLNIDYMQINDNMVTFQIANLLKNSSPRFHLNEISFQAYPKDNRICVVYTLKRYLEKTKAVRKEANTKQLLLTTRKPFKAASRDTIRRWAKSTLEEAGIDMSIFTAYSTRSAAASKAALSLSVLDIVKAIGWASQSTFEKYYLKDVQKNSLSKVLNKPKLVKHK